jgi:lysophospholipase L1-like esterase
MWWFYPPLLFDWQPRWSSSARAFITTPAKRHQVDFEKAGKTSANRGNRLLPAATEIPSMPRERNSMRTISSILFASLLTVALHSETALGQTNTAITPVPREGGWNDRAKLLDTRVNETPDTQLLMIGDSITQGWEGAGKEVWAKYYTPRKAVNLGIGGDRTQHVLWRLQNAPLDKVKPKAAVVMIGTNNSNGDDNTPGEIVQGVTAIVSELRKRLPNTKILLLAIFPRGENFNPQRGKITQVNQVLQKLDDGRNVFFLDIGHRFLNADGVLPKDVMPDFLHLNAKSYQTWAEAIEPKLKELIGD